jgi:hypothetical protein
MSLPTSLFKQQLYSILPELQELDKNVGPFMLQINIEAVKGLYSTQLSNCLSLDELITKNPALVSNYVNALECQIVLGNYPDNGSNIHSYFSQKISILENAYSNLVQSSTQSSQ